MEKGGRKRDALLGNYQPPASTSYTPHRNNNKKKYFNYIFSPFPRETWDNILHTVWYDVCVVVVVQVCGIMQCRRVNLPWRELLSFSWSILYNNAIKFPATSPCIWVPPPHLLLSGLTLLEAPIEQEWWTMYTVYTTVRSSSECALA